MYVWIHYLDWITLYFSLNQNLYIYKKKVRGRCLVLFFIYVSAVIVFPGRPQDYLERENFYMFFVGQDHRGDPVRRDLAHAAETEEAVQIPEIVVNLHSNN